MSTIRLSPLNLTGTQTERAQVRQRAQNCLTLLNEMLRPTDERRQVAELQAAGVSERRIAGLYPLDYERAISDLHASSVTLSNLVSGSAALNDLFYTMLLFSDRVQNDHCAATSNHLRRNLLLDAVYISRLLSVEDLPELREPEKWPVLCQHMANVERSLRKLRYRQSLMESENSLQRVALRLRHLPALLGLD